MLFGGLSPIPTMGRLTHTKNEYEQEVKSIIYLLTVRDNGLDLVHKCEKVFFNIRTNSTDVRT